MYALKLNHFWFSVNNIIYNYIFIYLFLHPSNRLINHKKKIIEYYTINKRAPNNYELSINIQVIGKGKPTNIIAIIAMDLIAFI